jgi:hypothetical protein
METLTYHLKVRSKFLFLYVSYPSCSVRTMAKMVGTNAVSLFGVDLL